MSDKSRALSIVGSSRDNGERQKEDFYPTPGYVVEELLKREAFTGITREPACGDGAISKVLLDHGMDVISTDIVDRGFAGTGIADFLAVNSLFETGCVMGYCNNIITNPPYSLALEFVLKSKEVASDKIAMFLKTVFLESEGRRDMFADTKFPLKAVYQFSKRVSLYKDGVKMKNSGMIAYAWFVWDKNHKGSPIIKWI